MIRRPITAFTLMELLVVIACFAILAALLIRSAHSSNAHSQRIACVSNLKLIGLGWQGYKIDLTNRLYEESSTVTNARLAPARTDADDAFRYFVVLSNELSTPKVLVCPADNSRSPANSFAALS